MSMYVDNVYNMSINVDVYRALLTEYRALLRVDVDVCVT